MKIPKPSEFMWGFMWALGVLFILVCVWDYVYRSVIR